MKLLFKQRLFSWLSSYDIYNEAGETEYVVKGQFALGHCLKIYNRYEEEVGTVKQRLFTFLPKFEIYLKDRYAGCICKEFSFIKPKFSIDCNGWQVDGDWCEWDYRIFSSSGVQIASVTKELWNVTDTYVIDVADPADALCTLMLVLAIDAEKSTRND